MAWRMLQEEVWGLLHPGPMLEVRAVLEYVLYKLTKKKKIFLKQTTYQISRLDAFKGKYYILTPVMSLA